MLKKLLALLLSAVTLLMTNSAAKNTVRAPKDEDDFLPVLRFVVASDTHIKKIGDERAERIQKILSLAYDDANNHPDYPKLDAAVFA